MSYALLLLVMSYFCTPLYAAERRSDSKGLGLRHALAHLMHSAAAQPQGALPALPLAAVPQQVDAAEQEAKQIAVARAIVSDLDRHTLSDLTNIIIAYLGPGIFSFDIAKLWDAYVQKLGMGFVHPVIQFGAYAVHFETPEHIINIPVVFLDQQKHQHRRFFYQLDGEPGVLILEAADKPFIYPPGISAETRMEAFRSCFRNPIVEQTIRTPTGKRVVMSALDWAVESGAKKIRVSLPDSTEAYVAKAHPQRFAHNEKGLEVEEICIPK